MTVCFSVLVTDSIGWRPSNICAINKVDDWYIWQALTDNDWHPGSCCGWACNQLTSKVDGGITGSRLSGQFPPSVWPHNPATGFRPPSATMVSAEPFSHGTGTLRCLQKEMVTYRHWTVSLWRDPDDVPHCRILSPDKTEWWLISATLCGWRCCFVADQLWFMTRIREEEEEALRWLGRASSKVSIHPGLSLLYYIQR